MTGEHHLHQRSVENHYSLWAGVVLRLAQTHAPEVLAELAAELDRLGFATWPTFPVPRLFLVATVFVIDPETPNRPLQLAERWLALSRRERFAHVTCLDLEGNYFIAYELADTLCELVRVAVQTGEITLIEGPEAAMEELQLADLRCFRAMRVEFREPGGTIDHEAAAPAEPAAAAENENPTGEEQPSASGEKPPPKPYAEAIKELYDLGIRVGRVGLSENAYCEQVVKLCGVERDARGYGDVTILRKARSFQKNPAGSCVTR